MRPDTRYDHLLRIRRVVSQIQSELDRTLTVTDIADIAALSPFHVIRVFREITGYTPAAMQTALRIQEAKRYLVAGNASVTDACFSVGFNSLGSFSQRFLQLTGVNPSDYRTAAGRVEPIIEQLTSIDRASFKELPTRNSVSGRVHGVESPDSFYFIGLFPPGPPRGRPLGGDARQTSGDFVIRHVPDGTYVIYSAVIARARSLKLVMPDTEIASGGGQIIQMVGGAPVTDVDIMLTPRTCIVTPIMTTLFSIPSLAVGARMNHLEFRQSA